MSTGILTVYAALCLTPCVMGSDMVFTSSPSTIRQLVTDDLTLRCSLKDSPSSVIIGKRHILSDVMSATAPTDVSFVHSITIKKAGVELATVSGYIPAKVFDNTTGVQVTGKVLGSGDEKGYLQVSWKYPGSGQSGNYQCVIRGVDQSGHNHDFSQSLDVSETEVSLADVVGYIHQLKLTNDLQTAANVALNITITGLNATNADLKSEIKALQTASNVGLNSTIADLKAEINDLKTKQNIHVMFTAIRTSDVHVTSSGVLVFDQLKSSVGGGYDVSTGVFTCPQAGYYTFDVHVTGQEDKYAYASLRHNDNIVTTALADDMFDYQSASTSASLQLQRGDTVKVTGLSSAYLYGASVGYSSFSGHLISVA